MGETVLTANTFAAPETPQYETRLTDILPDVNVLSYLTQTVSEPAPETIVAPVGTVQLYFTIPALFLVT